MKTKKIICILLSVAIVVSAFSVFFYKFDFKNYKIVSKFEKTYKENSTAENLYKLDTTLMESTFYRKILKYFPALLEDENLSENIIKDSFWKNELTKVESEDIVRYYLVTYLNAVYEIQGKEAFEKELYKYKGIFNLEVNAINIPVLQKLGFFLYKHPEKWSVFSQNKLTTEKILKHKFTMYAVDRKKTKEILQVFLNYIDTVKLSRLQIDMCIDFVYNRYSVVANQYMDEDFEKLIGLLDAPKNSVQKSWEKWSYELPNHYAIVKSEGVSFGRRVYKDLMFVYFEPEIEVFAYNEKYICIKRNDGNSDSYLVVDSENDEFYGPFDKNEYFDKIDSLNIIGLKYYKVTETGTEEIT